MVYFTERIVKYVGVKASLLSVVLTGVVCIDVLLRYLFKFSFPWILELEWYMFSLLFLFSGAYTYQRNKHVRVDIFYEKFSPRLQQIIDLVGDVLFMFPWCILVVSMSEYSAYQSWRILESSPDPGGLPARYIIKYAVPLAFLLLELQVVSNIYKGIRSIFKTSAHND